MSSKADTFLKKTLGNDFLQSLEKFELWKPNSKAVLDHEEIRTALQIVPRAVMAFLVRELLPIQVGENKDVEIPFDREVIMHVTKHERDVYSGQIDQDNKMLVEFKFRSLPGIGLVIMSALELYNIEDLEKPAQQEIQPDIINTVQNLVNERMALHDLIGKVVDKKLLEKDAINQLVLMKLTEAMNHKKTEEIVQPVETPAETAPTAPKKKELPLKEFLEKRQSKLKKNEFSIELAKGETVDCPDCGKNLFDGQVFSGCVCLGDDRERKVHLKKTEDGVKVRFGKGWDIDNIEMLLEVLRRKRG